MDNPETSKTIDLEAMRQRREAALGRFEELLRADERVVVAWLEGSYARGAIDAFSDIDLHIAVEDDALEAWCADRAQILARVGTLAMTMPPQRNVHGTVGEYQMCMFEGPLLVDLFVHPVSASRRDLDTLLLFARRPVSLGNPVQLSAEERHTELQTTLLFLWTMTPVALKMVARGETRRVVDLLGIRTNAFIKLWRLVHDPDRQESGWLYSLHPERDRELIALIPQLPSIITPKAALGAVTQLMDQIEALHPVLEELGIAIPHAAVHETRAFRDAIANGLADGTLPISRPSQS